MSEANDYILTMEGISKAFPGVQALESVDFTLRRGEIHCLVGENGAGKSTLIKVLTGVDRPDAGKIILDSLEIHARSPKHAQALGISTVYQEINLCMNLTVAENILLGREPQRFGSIDWARMNAEAAEVLQRLLGIEIDVTQPLGTYTVAIQQMVAIARALDIAYAKILILDDSTSSVDTETERLIQIALERLMENRTTFIIAHRLSSVRRADLIVVMKDGRIVEQGKHADLLSAGGLYREIYDLHLREQEQYYEDSLQASLDID